MKKILKSKIYIEKLLQELIVDANPRRELTDEETKRLSKLEAIADKLKRGENVQNHQLQIWLSEHEYLQIEVFEKGEFRLGRTNHL